MSGGGSKPSKGRMGCRAVEKVDRKTVEKLQHDLEGDIETLEVGIRVFFPFSLIGTLYISISISLTLFF